MKKPLYVLSLLLLFVLGVWVRVGDGGGAELGGFGPAAVRTSSTGGNAGAQLVHMNGEWLALLPALDLATAALIFGLVLLLLGPVAAWLVTALDLLQPAVWQEACLAPDAAVLRFLQAGLLLGLVLFFGRGRNSRLLGFAFGAFQGLGLALYPALAPYMLVFLGACGLRSFYTRRYMGPTAAACFAAFLMVSAWVWTPLGDTSQTVFLLQRP